jgi:hypothetical protein
MTSPWQTGPDGELGRRLRDELDGPDPSAYLGRLREFLLALPERDTEWDVLAHWARPGVVVAAMAASFLLGFALLTGWRDHAGPAPETAAGMPAAALIAPTAAEPGPITFAVLEGR